jgi:hypothetical protein
MNRPHFTRSLSINFSQISLFLFSPFIRFGPGAARTRYHAPDALLRSAFALSLYRWPTHNTLCCSLPPVPSLVSPRMILLSLPLVLYSALCHFWTHPEGSGWALNIHYCSAVLESSGTLRLCLSQTLASKSWVSGFAGSSATRGCRLTLQYKYIPE